VKKERGFGAFSLSEKTIGKVRRYPEGDGDWVSAGVRKDTNKIGGVLTYLTYKLGASGRLNKTRLMKLAYLAELKAIEKWGTRLTHIDFKNWNYGPYSHDIQEFLECAGPDIKREVKLLESGRIGEFFVPAKSKTQISLTMADIGLLDEVLAFWRYRDNNALIRNAKESPPFIWTMKGDNVPFDKYAEFVRELDEARSADFHKQAIVLANPSQVHDFLRTL